MATAGAASAAAFGATWNNVVVTGPVGRGTMHLAQLRSVASAVSPRPVKFCSGMGPANLGAWLTDRHYHDKAALYRDLADAYNAEFKDAIAAGVEIFQLDDVGFTLHAPEDYPLVVETLNRALDGVDAFRIFHICHLGSGAPVGITPYAGFHELVAKELQVDAVEYAFAETGFPDDDFALWSRFPSDKGSASASSTSNASWWRPPSRSSQASAKRSTTCPRSASTSPPTAASSPCPARSLAASSQP